MSETAVLDWIDSALDEGRVTASEPAGREVQALALDLRDEAPVPDPRFAAELDERVAAGFPRQRRIPALPRVGAGRRIRRSQVLAFGSAASILVAIAVGAALVGGSDETTPTTNDLSAPAGDMPESAPSARQSLPGDAGAATIAPGEPRRIERSAQLTLAAPEDEIERVADDVVAVTDRHRGFVERSSVSSGDSGSQGGSFALRIPANELRATLRDLSALADVRGRSQSGEDVTGSYVRTADRLAELKAERRSLLRQLERAPSADEGERIRRRLDAVSREIGLTRGNFARIREQVRYADVTVSLVAKRDRSEGGGGAAGDIDDALDDAIGAMSATLGIALRVLGVLIPLAILAALAWVAAATLRRRRREAVLS